MKANGSIFVRPVAGRSKVRDPRTMQHLRDEGQLVAEESYWYRRQADGDVEIFDEAPAEKTTTVKEQSK